MMAEEQTETRVMYPAIWEQFQKTFQDLGGDIDESFVEMRGLVNRLQVQIKNLQNKLDKSANINIPKGLPESLVDAAEGAVRTINAHQKELTESLKVAVEDFKHAEDNMDRFTVLVFGEVNAGKSALANHLAGCDFDLPPDLQLRELFMNDKVIFDRLEESPIECTKDYQGFRLPGLHWIDCPGVLSTTMENSEFAKRQVGKADFILFVSSSDAPMKESELKELARLLEASGSQSVDACLVITKVDESDEEEDPETEELIRFLKRKSDVDQDKQKKWCKEQQEKLDKSGLSQMSALHFYEPLALSVFIARDKLGRVWETGEYKGNPKSDWENTYEESGIPELCRMMIRTVNEHGAEIKAAWPRKREAAINKIIKDTCGTSLSELSDLTNKIENQRKLFNSVKKKAINNASALVIAGVQQILINHGINDFEKFDSKRAALAIQKHSQKVVAEVVVKALEETVEGIFFAIDNAIQSYFENMNHTFDLRIITRERTYYSTAKSEAVGGGMGAAGGAWAGAEAGAVVGTFFGPIGTLVGGIAGGLICGILGGWAGSKVAKAVHSEKITVEEPVGTNAFEVMQNTNAKIKVNVEESVEIVFSRLESMIFSGFLHELRRIEAVWKDWSTAFDAQSPN